MQLNTNFIVTLEKWISVNDVTFRLSIVHSVYKFNDKSIAVKFSYLPTMEINYNSTESRDKDMNEFHEFLNCIDEFHFEFRP